MNLDSSLAFFVKQGPVFWAAAAAVGAGGALLVTSLFVWLRGVAGRVNLRPRIALPRRSKAEAAPPAASRPGIRVTDTGYALAGAGAPTPEATAGAPIEDLGALLERLKNAGNRLEEAISGGPRTESRHSRLKATAAMDEHETRVGVG